MAKNKSSTGKGRLVEKIAASMYNRPDVKVQRNVFLTPRGSGGKNRKKREIDVLVTGKIAGQPVNIAIECKNLSKPVGAPDIDAFVGKLQDVGIPIGIYISKSRYTNGAIERAREANIRPLRLSENVLKNLDKSVREAIQSSVYLLLNVKGFALINKFDGVINTGEGLLFYEQKDGIWHQCGTVLDIIWNKWNINQLPTQIGDHDVMLDVPERWQQVINGRIEPVLSLSAHIRVVGLVVMLYGKAKEHVLVDATTDKIERSQLEISFDASSDTYPVKMVTSENELNELINQPSTFKITRRLLLPRIATQIGYWPPSERVFEKITTRMRAYEAGEIPDPRPFNFGDLEGTDISKNWADPIWSDHEKVQRALKSASNKRISNADKSVRNDPKES